MAAKKKLSKNDWRIQNGHLGKYEAIKIKATLNKMLAAKICVSG